MKRLSRVTVLVALAAAVAYPALGQIYSGAGSNVSVPVSVSNGGTGGTTVTAHGLIVGEGASAFASLAVCTASQVVVGAAAADPVCGNVPAAALATQSSVAAFYRGIWIGGTQNSITTSRFTTISGSLATDQASEAQVQQPLPAAVVVKNLSCVVNSTPNPGGTWTFTIRKGGADTALKCTVSTGTTCTDTSDSVSFASTDLIDVSEVSTGTPTNATAMKCGVEYDI